MPAARDLEPLAIVFKDDRACFRVVLCCCRKRNPNIGGPSIPAVRDQFGNSCVPPLVHLNAEMLERAAKHPDEIDPMGHC